MVKPKSLTPRIQDRVFPFSYVDWDDLGFFMVQYYDVVFSKSFGLIPAGAKYSAIQICFEQGIIEVLDEDGEITHAINFEAMPVTR